MDLLIMRAQCYNIPTDKTYAKALLDNFRQKFIFTAIFDANKFMQGGDKSKVVHVWLRLLLKPDDPFTYKNIQCSEHCSCFKLISDTFSISYNGSDLWDPKAVMLLISFVLWVNSTSPVITVEEDKHPLFLLVYHTNQQHASVWLQTMTNLQLLATWVCHYHVVMLWWYHLTTFMSVKSAHLAQQYFQKDAASVSIYPTSLRGR